MRTLLRKTSLAVFIVLVFAIAPAPTFLGSLRTVNAQLPPVSESRTRYNMVVDLDYENARLTTRESIVYTNNTSVDLSSVVFNVTPAEFKAFALNAASVDGKRVTPTMDDVVMEVPLPQILPRGKAATIDLDFRVNVPRRGGRFGMGDGIIALGNWFPVVAVYNDARLASNERPSGWSKHEYVEVGDAFFTETADYTVTVNTSTPVTIAHTGDLVGKDSNRYQIRANGVRDFAMAISNRYQTQSKTVDGVVITAYYLREHATAGAQYLEAASRAMRRLGRLVTPYPYSTLHIAEVYAQSSIAMGQEYPNLIFISSTANDLGGGVDSYLFYVVMHEVAHQWFYSMVGNDQVYQPWLDEALATWFGFHVLRLEAPDLFGAVWQKRLLDPLAESTRRNGDSPVNRSIYDFPEELHYYNIVYRKGALFIEELYKAMGEDKFFEALRDYGVVFRDRIATPIAFFDLLQSHTSEKLNQTIAKYFSYDRYRATVPPLGVSVEFPPGLFWSGLVRPEVRSNYPIDSISLFVEDRLVSSGDAAQIAVDTRGLKDGEEYLLTIKVSSAKQMVERVQRFRVLNETPGERSPTAVVPAPASPPSPTAAPEEEQNTGHGVLTRENNVWAILAIVLVVFMGIVYAVRRAR